ncbi:MAG: hypothetical protein JXR83_19075 [Deltaproteobacteria bacterium]|nr:hypothetical protein [Deltaproteobacteria bacterium]
MVPGLTGCRPRRLAALLLAVSALCCAGAGCRRVDAAERIRELVRSAAKAAGERDLAGVMANVASDFSGRLGVDSDDEIVGTLDARQLRFLLLRYLQRGGVTVLIRSIDVALEGPRARATVLAMISQRGGSAGPRGQTEPDRGELLRLELALEKRDDKWWVIAAERTPVEAGEFLLGK